MSLYRFIAADQPMDAFSVGIEVLSENMIRVDEERNLEIAVDDWSYSSVYTKKPYIMSIQFDQFSGIAEDLLAYIRRQMERHKSLALWSMWMDERERPEKRAVNVEDLTVEELGWIYGIEIYEHPQCLKVYRWSR